MSRKNGAPQATTPAKRQEENPHAEAYYREQYSTKLASVLPHEMKRRQQFVCWRYELRDGELAKVPYNAQTGYRAKTACKEKQHKGTHCLCARKTWSTFAQAVAAYKRSNYDGIGIVLADGLAGTDIDDCIDLETGQIKPWALAIIIAHGGGIAEKSPSKTGAHVYWLGTVPAGRKKTALEDGAVEMYAYADGGRFFTLTGDILIDDGTNTLDINQQAVNALHASIFPAKAPKAETPARAHVPLSMDDSELLTRARNNPDGSKAARFRALYDAGDTSGYKSQSEADAALCNDLAYMCGPGAEARVADLFRRSALYREKADRDDYVARTVALAYDGRTAFYQPREKSIDYSADYGDPDAPTPPADEVPEMNQLNSEDRDADELARLRAENARMRQQLAQIRAVVNADGMQVAPLEKVIQIDFIVNAFTENSRDADGFTVIKIEAKKDEATGAIKGRPGLADKHGVSRGTVTKALDNIAAFGTARFDKTEPKKMPDGSMLCLRKVAPPVHFAPKWERPDGPRKQMGGARPGAGRKAKCATPGCDGELEERRGVETKEHEYIETHCTGVCGEVKRRYTGKVTTVSSRAYSPEENQLNSADDAMSVWPDLAAAANQRNSPSVDASVRKIENPSPASPEHQLIPDHPQRPCIRCRAYDWRWTGERWVCVCMLPDAEEAHATPYGVSAYPLDGEWLSVVDADRRPRKSYATAASSAVGKAVS